VAATRRWFDRGDPRDAGECHACQMPEGTVSQRFPFSCIAKNRPSGRFFHAEKEANNMEKEPSAGKILLMFLAGITTSIVIGVVKRLFGA